MNKRNQGIPYGKQICCHWKGNDKEAVSYNELHV